MRRFEVVKDCPFPVKLPERSTSGAAGYDFFASYPFAIGPGETLLVKTWVKARMNEGEVLLLVERSSWGFKKHISIPNAVGIIDADYYGNEDNDGNIMFAFTNHGKEPLEIKEGERIGQGIFINFLKADNDSSEGKRQGGIGSTGE
ncbi:dUTP diphosphatase [uncultured Dialister sp.]|jgi:dUTP pyrophosphatase|uniref:dUTP diphosphatase n=1 Tax=uncultured Dialister sp. TaxID=278064 RepID=UPI00261AE003|nr:dUTP diphosphatase [uncultured Dialister sp.]